MKKIYFLYILFSIPFYLICQVNAPYINNGVTFQWDGAQPNNNSPARIQSITINGQVFDLFAVPSAYELTQLGPGGHGANRIFLNGAATCVGSNNACWPASALAAYQDVNLNHYFEGNPNGRDICNNFGAVPTTDAQRQSLIYSPPIPSNQGGVVAVTERGANNCFHILVEGTPPGGGPVQILGQTFVVSDGNLNGNAFNPPVGNSHYWQSGRTNENGQSIGIALYRLEDLAPTGSLISRVQLTAATTDHGDGKFFILQQYAIDDLDTTIYQNSILNGDVADNDNVPSGSSFTLQNPPVNGALIFNPDGTFSYFPNPTFIGVDSFTYEVCLPAPNQTICDQATQVIYVNPLAEIGIISTPVCIGELQNFSASNSGLLANYFWEFGAGANIPTSNSQFPSGIGWNTLGTKTVVLTVSGNGVSETDTAFIEVFPLPTIGGPTEVNVGYTINITPSSGGTWTSANNLIATVNNSGIVTGISEGLVELTFTDDISGCVSTVTINVVQLRADLSIAKTVTNANPDVGEGITFTITVQNNGPDDVDNVIATDLLPAGFTHVSNNSGGSYNPSSGVWTIGNLSNGASVSLNITVTVNATGNYNNYVTVFSNNTFIVDPNLTNNSDNQLVTVDCEIRNITPNINNN